MTIYIQGAGCISPQPVDGSAPEGAGGRLRAVEPDYRELIDTRLLRRMSRAVKMGTAAAMACLQEAGVIMPDAIVTGTAYGCTEDTDVFLQRMVAQNETMLTPTAFIQSTHNTIGAQIALMLQCHGYNNTVAHRAFSFEHALTDGLLLVQEGEAATVLVGGVDEMTDRVFQVLSRFNLFERAPAGEGAAFFLLGGEKTAATSTRLLDVATAYQPADIGAAVENFLGQNGLTPDDVDLLLLGQYDHDTQDPIYAQVRLTVGEAKPVIPFKQSSGEYPVATAYATWLASRIFAGHEPPPGLAARPRNILIYNHFFRLHHSMILLGAC